MSMLETAGIGLYAFFWNDIFDRVNASSKILQNPKLDLNTAVATVKSLRTFVESKRDCFAEYESKGADISGTTEYVQTRTRRQNVRLQPLDYGRGPASVLSASES